MVEWDEIHWVKTSSDIPKNDFLNFTCEELAKKSPKISKEHILLERHKRFPRKFPIPPEYRKAGLEYRRTLVVNTLSELRDSIFKEHDNGQIAGICPQFTVAQIQAERDRRQVLKLAEGIQVRLTHPSPGSTQILRSDIGRVKQLLEGLKPLSDETAKIAQRMDAIEANIGSG